MRQLVLVAEIAIAGIKVFGQQEQTADAVPVLGEVGRMTEFVNMTLRVVGPDMLEFVPCLAFAHVVKVSARVGRACVST
jgi:hypothetical protein